MAGDNLYNPMPSEDLKNLGLIGRVTRTITDFLKRPGVPVVAQMTDRPTTEAGVGDTAVASFGSALWRLQHDRRAVYTDLREMNLCNPLIHRAMDIIADCTVGYEDTDVDGFEWQMEVDNPAAMQLLDELKSRLDLGSECWQIVRNYVQYGEEFREVVTDEEMLIRRFKSLPAWTIMPKFDTFGNKAPGWEQRLDGTQYSKPRQFEEWQIIAFVYGQRRGWYGTGLMMAARGTHRRLQKMEDGMAIARMVRAYDKLLHKVPVKPDWNEKQRQSAVLEYRKNITQKRGLDDEGHVNMRPDPFTVDTDFFIAEDGTGRGDVNILSGKNEQLQNITDLLYHQDLLVSALGVPRKYLNLTTKSGGLTDGSLSAEDIQFARTLRQTQAVLRSGIMRLGTLALFLQGFDADKLGLGLNLPKISTQDLLNEAKIQLTQSQAAKFYSDVMGGLPWELVAGKYMGLSDDEKDLVKEFQDKKDAEEEAMKKLALENPGALLPGHGMTPPNPKQNMLKPPNPKAGVPPKEIAQVAARLAMMCQSELEARGVHFAVGYEERFERALQSLADIMHDA
jgi:hypothetical protein